MKKKCIFAIGIAGATVLIILVGGLGWAIRTKASTSSPSGSLMTAFTYQGYLTAGGEPANGEFDFTFDLYPEETTGTLINSVILDNVPVTGGVFTVWLDYGSGVFDGDERWLEISVRPGAETGVYTPLAGRQALTAAPYAIYAIEAGVVEWEGVQNRPPGLDDGDDDTTYTVGYGLNLSGTTLEVVTSAIQARVSGECSVGSTVRSIYADGSVLCEVHDTQPVFSQNAIDVNDAPGYFTSITIGADGLPIISNIATYNDHLKVSHCRDVACKAATNYYLDDAYNWGETSIAIGSDGLPVISYFGSSGQGLKFAHCQDFACTTVISKTLDSTANPGSGCSIAIGIDGFPIISYGSVSSTLNVAHCNDQLCGSVDLNVPVSPAYPGSDQISIAIGIDGMPVISYFDAFNNDLNFAHCNNHTCTSAITRNLDSTGDVGYDSSLTIGSDGFPIISYLDGTPTDWALKLAHCDDVTCSTFSTLTLDTVGDVGSHSSITIGSDGLPVISYFDTTNKNLKIVHCSNYSCTSSSILTVDSSNNVGSYSSITIGTDGYPIISYLDGYHSNLKVTHCSNPFCIKYWRRR